VELEWNDEANRTGFLIAGEGDPGQVKSVALSWPNHAETPWAIPLMIIGGVAFIAGLVLLFIGANRAKKEANRRRARQERRRKLAEFGTAFAIVPVLALSACGSEELPKPEPSEEPSSAPAGVTDDQAQRILESVADQVKAADKGPMRRRWPSASPALPCSSARTSTRSRTRSRTRSCPRPWPVRTSSPTTPRPPMPGRA
jgi:hypothetical protein